MSRGILGGSCKDMGYVCWCCYNSMVKASAMASVCTRHFMWWKRACVGLGDLSQKIVTNCLLCL